MLLPIRGPSMPVPGAPPIFDIDGMLEDMDRRKREAISPGGFGSMGSIFTPGPGNFKASPSGQGPIEVDLEKLTVYSDSSSATDGPTAVLTAPADGWYSPYAFAYGGSLAFNTPGIPGLGADIPICGTANGVVAPEANATYSRWPAGSLRRTRNGGSRITFLYTEKPLVARGDLVPGPVNYHSKFTWVSASSSTNGAVILSAATNANGAILTQMSLLNSNSAAACALTMTRGAATANPIWLPGGIGFVTKTAYPYWYIPAGTSFTVSGTSTEFTGSITYSLMP